MRAQLAKAQEARERDCADEAIQILLDALHRARDCGAREEGVTLANLALLLMQQGRDVESLAYSHHAVGVLEHADADEPLLRARQLLAVLLARFEDWPRFDRERADIEAAIAALPADQRAGLEHAHRMMLAGTALERGAFDDTLRHLAEIESYDPSLDEWVLALRGYSLAAAGRAREAQRIVEALRALDTPSPWLPIWIETTAARIAPQLAETDVAVARVAQALDRLAGPELGTVGNRTAMILQLAESLPPDGAFAAVARRAFDLVVDGVLARIAEVERFTRAQPLQLERDAEQRRLLRELRQRLHASHRELYAAIAERFRGITESGDTLAGCIPEDDPHIVLCAWCSCVRHQTGSWLPIGSFLPDSRTVPLTHGICPACRDEVAVAR